MGVFVQVEADGSSGVGVLGYLGRAGSEETESGKSTAPREPFAATKGFGHCASLGKKLFPKTRLFPDYCNSGSVVRWKIPLGG
ncbi:hypothetical protein D3C83_132470 [compost metagenome]